MKKLAFPSSNEPKPSLANAVIRRVNGPSDEATLRAIIETEVHESRKRRTGPGERVTVILPPDLLECLRLAAVKERRSLSDAMTEAGRVWLQQRA